MLTTIRIGSLIRMEGRQFQRKTNLAPATQPLSMTSTEHRVSMPLLHLMLRWTCSYRSLVMVLVEQLQA
ncbi:hypothetical protein XHC_4201 [Xanthomonas hortorum pv. carotae str. M081]|nr:hypothetical protein XHC_4201 [Xanthomonas hortorum pv. carotae str. M081]